MLASFIGYYNNKNTNSILKYKQEELSHLLNYTKKPTAFYNAAYNYIIKLQDYGYFSQAKILLDAIDIQCINNPDYNVWGVFLYPDFRNYFLQKDTTAADSIIKLTDDILKNNTFLFLIRLLKTKLSENKTA